MSKKSKRIYILNDEEINFLYTIPKFSSDEREVFFSLTELEHEELNKISDLPTKIHFILQLGYFKAKQKLFQYNYSSVDDDVKFIVNKYFPNLEQSRYFLSNANKSQNNKRILTLTGFKEFTENIKQQVVEYAISLAHRLINHVTIFSELVGYIHTRNIILPAYTVMQDLITFAISIEERRLSNMIAMKLTRELDDFLMNMLTNQKDLGLLSFKKMPKNFKYRALKEEIDKGSTFRSAYFFAKQFLNDADISEYNIKYYAMVAEEYNIGQLKKLKPTSAKLYLLCYIYYRYQQINDNLLICYNYYADKFDKECKIHVMQKLIEHTKSYQANIPKVSNLLRFISNEQAESMEHKEFYNQAYRILEKQEYNPTADYLDGVSFNEKEVKWDYYLKISDRIKRYYRPMLRHLDLQYDKEKMAIVPGIKFLKKELSKSKVSFNKISNDNFPEGFIGKEERKYLKYKQDNEFIYEPNKYELYTYFAISRAINRGKVYCNESIRHKSLKSDLLSDERWKNKEEWFCRIC